MTEQELRVEMAKELQVKDYVRLASMHTIVSIVCASLLVLAGVLLLCTHSMATAMYMTVHEVEWGVAASMYPKSQALCMLALLTTGGLWLSYLLIKLKEHELGIRKHIVEFIEEEDKWALRVG